MIEYSSLSLKGCNCRTDIGAVDDNCDSLTGRCRCKIGYSGKQCESCGNGYFKIPDCIGTLHTFSNLLLLFLNVYANSE